MCVVSVHASEDSAVVTRFCVCVCVCADRAYAHSVCLCVRSGSARLKCHAGILGPCKWQLGHVQPSHTEDDRIAWLYRWQGTLSG